MHKRVKPKSLGLKLFLTEVPVSWEIISVYESEVMKTFAARTTFIKIVTKIYTNTLRDNICQWRYKFLFA